MSNHDFTFTSETANRFPLVQADGSLLEAEIERGLGCLRLTADGHHLRDFPLVVEGEPNPQAVFITQSDGCPPHLEVGTVDFGEQPCYLENHELNDQDFRDEWTLGLADGHVGILDLRNLRISNQTIFALEKVPLQLSISGIYLRATTLKYIPGVHAEAWYQKSNL